MALSPVCASRRHQEQQAWYVKQKGEHFSEAQDVLVEAVDQHQHVEERYYSQRTYCQTLKILMNSVDGNKLPMGGSPL